MQRRSFFDRQPWLEPLPPAVVWGVLWLLATMMCCAYARIYDQEQRTGWTKLIGFGAAYAPASLPTLKATRHYVDPNPANQFGYDGQFYAQLALDPSLRKPAFDTALDLPAYRARRIGLPALSYLLGAGKRRWILQIYSVSNLFFWFALALVLRRLLGSQHTVQSLLCLVAALLGFGVIESMTGALTDLPAATLMFGALLANFAGGAALLSAAILTRETSALAALASAVWRRPSRLTLGRDALRLALALAPFALWFLYLKFRFSADASSSGEGNFGWPLAAFGQRLIQAWHKAGNDAGLQETARHLDWRHLVGDDSVFHLVCGNFALHELLVLFGLFAQGLYLLVRPQLDSVVWRIGIGYLLLACLLGPSVWEESRSCTRVLLPLSIAFCLRLASERRQVVFWPFFLVTALSIPFGLSELATLCGF